MRTTLAVSMATCEPAAACGHSDGGVGDCGGVIDAVADPGNLVFPGAQLDPCLDLVIGQQIAPGLVESEVPCDGVYDGLVVSGEMALPRDPRASSTNPYFEGPVSSGLVAAIAALFTYQFVAGKIPAANRFR